MDLSTELLRGKIDLPTIGSQLDALAPEARIAAVRGLKPRAQALLYEAAAGVRALSLDDIVPRHVPAGVEVPHLGRNSMSAFKQFAKVFRRSESDARLLWGYNRCSGFVETVVGPGYYAAYEGGKGELLVDYTRQPSKKLANWPDIIPNEARLGRFVYAGMVDVLRGVSSHVSIGRAVRRGKVADNWFVLCRSVD